MNHPTPTTQVEPSPEDTGPCHFCGKTTDAGNWCHGCKTFICDKCDNPELESQPWGPHNPDDHHQE